MKTPSRAERVNPVERCSLARFCLIPACREVTQTYTPKVKNSLSITKQTMGERRDAMARANLTDEDEGKAVVNSAGDKIGMVQEVRGGNAHVNPDPGITDKISSKLGWGDADTTETYELQSTRVETITDDEIRLKD